MERGQKQSGRIGIASRPGNVWAKSKPSVATISRWHIRSPRPAWSARIGN